MKYMFYLNHVNEASLMPEERQLRNKAAEKDRLEKEKDLSKQKDNI